MSFQSYQYFALLPSKHPVFMHELKEKIEKRFKNDGRRVVMNSTNNRLTMDFGDWSFRIFLNTESYVQKESEEIADKFASGRSDQQQIKAVRQRIETVGDCDLDLEYLNDVIFILEIIEENYDAILFNPQEGEFV